MAKTVGVLALQGDFLQHEKALSRIRIQSKRVRTPKELERCDALILPGGESTTFINLLKKTGLYTAIQQFAKNHPLMGTCAGLITLSTKVTNNTMKPLGLIDIEVERNAYGRQIDSFIDVIQIPLFKNKPRFEGVFIRAPKIHHTNKSVETLAFRQNEVVMARNSRVLVTTFHPELTKDGRVHQYFVESFIG
jgi:5'-phosphate synthase pdxT subunit